MVGRWRIPLRLLVGGSRAWRLHAALPIVAVIILHLVRADACAYDTLLRRR